MMCYTCENDDCHCEIYKSLENMEKRIDNMEVKIKNLEEIKFYFAERESSLTYLQKSVNEYNEWRKSELLPST